MTQAGRGEKRERENDDGGDDQPPRKMPRVGDADDADDVDDADGQPPPPPPPPPAPPSCSICLDALTGVPFAQDPNQGTITLVCEEGQVPHEFHGDCLQDWVYKSCFNPDQVGQVVAGVNFWFRLPPRCPNCRAQFVAATYWPEYAEADTYPPEGVQYTTQLAVDTSDSEGSEESMNSENSDSEDSDSSEDDNQQVGAQPYQLADDSSDDDAPYEVTIDCDTCHVHGTHDEMTADALIDAHGDGHHCTRCPTPIQRGDAQPVLRCRACGATSHYHD